MRFLRFLPILSILFLASCDSAPFVPRGSLVVGIEAGPSTLDPRFATDAISSNISGLVYAGLLRRNRDMELELDIAESITLVHETIYLIRLRKGVLFQSGKPLTSADVRYTFESIVDPKMASPKKSAFEKVTQIDTPDPHTVIIRLSEPFAPFLGNLTMGIVQEGSSDITRHPIGAGPFKFVDYARGDSLFLVMNGPYFREVPKITSVLFRILPDETVRLLELKKGNVHLVQNPITPAVLPWLEKQEGIKVRKKIGTNVSYIGFNMRDEILKNKKVRLAIAHAIDRESIIKHLLKGLAVKTGSLISPASDFYNESLKPVEYDPAKSRKLLDEAGFPEKSGGKPRFKLTFKTSKNPTRKKIAEIFAQQLKEVGIEIEIKSFEWGTFYSDIKKGNFQLYSLTWVGIADPDIYHYIFHSKSVPPDGANRGRYANRYLDGLLEMGRLEPNIKHRVKIYQQVQSIIADDMPYVHLWVSVNVAAMSEKVKGFEIYPDESLFSLTRVTLEE